MLLRTCLVLSLLATACGGDDGTDADPFDTLQMCFDEHHVTESLPTTQAIVVCCIDHPIGGQDANVVCGETAAACETFLDTALDTASASQTEITNACADYIIDRMQ